MRAEPGASFGARFMEARTKTTNRCSRPGYKCHPGAGRATTYRMTDVLRFVVGLAADVVRGHAALVAENALLRQQLIVAQRKSPCFCSCPTLGRTLKEYMTAHHEAPPDEVFGV